MILIAWKFQDDLWREDTLENSFSSSRGRPHEEYRGQITRQMIEGILQQLGFKKTTVIGKLGQ